MSEHSSNAVLQYINGEISFTEWLEKDSSISSTVSRRTHKEKSHENTNTSHTDTQQNDDDVGEDEEDDATEDLAYSEVSTPTVPSPVSMTTAEEDYESSNQQVNIIAQTPQPSTSRGVPQRMTDLLLDLPAAKNASKPGGTSVDEFLADIPSMSHKGKKSGRPKRGSVPPKFQRQIGEANIACAKGEYARAKDICYEIIKQDPKCAEPFELLGMVYEMQKDEKKALQFFLITAYLKKSTDTEEWLKLAAMSLEQENYKQALTCYNQALKHDPDNVGILWERAALCYQLGDFKKAMEYYRAVLKALLPTSDVNKLMDLTTEMAMIYHEHDSLMEAIEVMETAFERFPGCSDLRAINVLAELYMTARHYAKALKLICSSCQITQEVQVQGEPSEPLSSFSNILGYDREASPQKKKVAGDINISSKAKWILNDWIPIDLRVKIAVCLIHLHCLHPVQDLIAPLFEDSVESAGDLYLDIAEAYVDNSDYEEALPIFDILVACDKYNQAGVWLKKAQALMSLARLEEAAFAFQQVVALAPTHLEARLTLASLLQQLGQHEKALEILTNKPREQDQDASATPMDTSEYDGDEAAPGPAPADLQPQDLRLLYHKCTLLKSQERIEEFTDTACQMFSVYFKDVYNKPLEDLIACANSSMIRNKKSYWGSSNKGKKTSSEGGAERDESVVRKEEWWEMLKLVIIEVSRLKKHVTALHLLLCGLSSEQFRCCKYYQKELQFMGVIGLFLTGRKTMSFDYIRQIIQERPTSIVLWNMFGRLVADTPDSRSHRYCLRLLIKHPDLLPLVIVNGHNCFTATSYKIAITEYVRAFRQSPDNPLISLCLGIQYLHLAGQRFPIKRHSLVIQAFLFLYQYMSLRGECQEAYYNIGRAFHQLGLFHFATHYYEKALACPYYNDDSVSTDSLPKVSERHDLHREASYNLCLIYKASGNFPLAREIMSKYLVI